jgi:hypothetical protein
MIRLTASCSLLFILTSANAVQAEPSKQLVGRYQMEVDGNSLMDLRTNGTVVMEGQEARWSVKGNQLTIGADTVTFHYQAGRLVMQMAQSLELAWRKVEIVPGTNPLKLAAAKVHRLQQASAPQAGAPYSGYGQPAQAYPGYGQPAQPYQGYGQPAQPSPAGQAQVPTPNANQAGSAADEQARQMLMSSAWCSFSYKAGMNYGNGVSNSSRVVFRPDGTMFMGTGSDSYYSGNAGSVAGQGVGQNVMRWKVQNLRLLVDSGQGFQDIGLEAYKNSAGYPILKAQGKEYSMCK